MMFWSMRKILTASVNLKMDEDVHCRNILIQNRRVFLKSISASTSRTTTILSCYCNECNIINNQRLEVSSTHFRLPLCRRKLVAVGLNYSLTLESF